MVDCAGQILISQQNSADTGDKDADECDQEAFFSLFALLFAPRE
jgi:hypothetical protein